MNDSKLPEANTLPRLSVDIGMLDSLFSDPSTLSLQPSSFDFQKLQQQTNDCVKNIFSSIDLTKVPNPTKGDLEKTYAYTLPSGRPIETLPKTLDELKNVFPNFIPPAETALVPSVSSLESRRSLHEETKKELTPVEKMLDQNFKQMHATIQQALSAARSARIKFDENILNGPIHPYQKLVYQYLGPTFKTPTIEQLEVPIDFCPVTALQKLNNITNSVFENTVTQFQHLTAGIGKIENDDERALMEGLGHGFSVLSATSEGTMFVIDANKTAKYIEFAELVRNISVKEIINNPIQTAQILINRLTQIFEPTQQDNLQVAVKNINSTESKKISLPPIALEERVTSQRTP